MGWMEQILGNPPDEHFKERFWSKVLVASKGECWIWKACVGPRGYGAFQAKKSRPVAAHRVAYCISHNDIQATSLVCHTCDNRRCCNPNHLVTGTALSNMQDMISKGRSYHPPLRGQENGMAKLNEDVVRRIRANPDGLSQRALGRMFGVSGHTIYSILKGLTWNHVR